MLNRDELLKEKLIDKKDDIKNVFANRLTYEKWDKKSPVYVYNIFNSEFEKIDDISRISIAAVMDVMRHSVDLNLKKYLMFLEAAGKVMSMITGILKMNSI